MTKEETFEYNKRCAKFLNVMEFETLGNNQYRIDVTTFTLDEETDPVKYFEDVYCNPDTNTRYKYDWNCIMQIIEAIEKLEFGKQKYKFQVVIQNNSCVIEQPYCFNSIRNYAETKNEAVVQSINQFLIWYNEQDIKQRSIV